MSKILVLGAGMVGSAMAIDLSKKYEVSIADFNKKHCTKC
jgi:saccharopine dehydrogenase-like NADP-dependent oxidoreductase